MRPPRRLPPRQEPPLAAGAVPATYPYDYPYPLSARRHGKAEDDPFSQLGWRAGAFLVLPSVELTTGYDTNPSRTVGGGVGAPVYIVAPELIVRSDWSRHALNADLRGSYTTYGGNSGAFDRPDFSGIVDGRVDVSRATEINLQGRLIVSTDNPWSPNVQAGLARLPIYSVLGGTAGMTQRFNRLELSAKGLVDRTVYQNSVFTDGETGSNQDRDMNQYGVQLRAGYETLPGVKPFVEVDADQRQHDLTFDRFGFQRDSVSATGRLGTTVNLPGRLTGEISAGYTQREYKDPGLQTLSGFVADGSLVWAATGLTTATVTARSAANELIVPGESGYLSRDYGLQVDHAFRRWLIGTLKFGAGFDHYVGETRDDVRYSTSAALTYKLTRTLQIKGEYRHEWLTSSAAGHDYVADIFLIGMRLQR